MGNGAFKASKPKPAAPKAPPAWDVATLTAAVDAMPAAVEWAKTKQLAAKAPPLPKPPGKALAADMLGWTFDIFGVEYSGLPGVAFAALTSHPELPVATTEAKKKLWYFVCELASFYHERPFHSFRHAVDVLLATSSLTKQMLLDRPECFGSVKQRDSVVAALLIGALVHDVNHPGCMNPLLIALGSPLAAGDTSAVLERHHAELALTLLDRPPLDFLSHLGEERGTLVGLIREIVLATDVTNTMPLAKEVSALVEAGTAPACMQVARLIIKAADISNPARALGVYQRWIDGVMVEFFVQGDVEKGREMKVSMNCDRETVGRAKCQVGFITFLVGPLFKSLLGLAPSLQPMVDSLEANRAHFAAEAAQ